MTTRTDDFALFVAVLTECAVLYPPVAGFNPAHVAKDAATFRRMARALERLAVKDCNEGLTELEAVREHNLRAKVIAGAKGYGANAAFGGDPRGYVLKLTLPTGRYNTMGGVEEGWGVPT